MYLPEPGYKRVIVMTFYIALGALLTYLFFKYVFAGVAPFLFGWLFAYMFQPAIRYLTKFKISKKISAVLFVLVTLSLLILILILIINRIIDEIYGLNDYFIIFKERLPDYADSFGNWLNDILEKFPFLDGNGLFAAFNENLNNLVISGVQSLTPYIPGALSQIVTFVPFALLYLLVTVIAACYFGSDFDRINAFITAQLPERSRFFLREVKNQLFATTFKYFRAYMLLILITFTELYVGLTIIGIPYSFIIALLIAIIDVLPVLGTGTVLIPWAIIQIITKDYFVGISLLVLYGIITVIRQIIEPRIVGNYIGLYPLVTLIAMYVGVKLFGILGLFLLPIAIIILKNMNDKGDIHLFKMPEKAGTDDTAKVNDKKKTAGK